MKEMNGRKMAVIDDDDVLLWGIAAIVEEEDRAQRRFWVHPWNEKRDLCSYIQELRTDENRFKNFTRMSIATFDYLLHIVGEDLTKFSTNWRKPIAPEARLLLTLR